LIPAFEFLASEDHLGKVDAILMQYTKKLLCWNIGDLPNSRTRQSYIEGYLVHGYIKKGQIIFDSWWIEGTGSSPGRVDGQQGIRFSMEKENEITIFFARELEA
jgi:hypothetical protein